MRSRMPTLRSRSQSIESLEQRLLLAAGTLDASFSSDGRATIDLGIGLSVRDVAVQSDGKVVVVGSTQSATPEMVIARFNADGTPDTRFGTFGDGTLRFRFGDDDPTGNQLNAVTIQNDGRIVAVGSVRYSGLFDAGSRFFAMRLLSNGTLDTTFSDDGRRDFDFGSSTAAASDVSVQSDGKILITGHRYPFNLVSTANRDFAAVRVHADGSYDETFGDGGRKWVDFGAYDDSSYASAIDVSGTSATNPWFGSSVLVGSTRHPEFTHFGTGWAITRLSPAGLTQASFGDNGRVTIAGTNWTALSAHAVLIQPSGRIVVAGHRTDTSFDPDVFLLARYEPNGQLDTTFGTNGYLTIDFGGKDAATSLISSNDGTGSLIVAGVSTLGLATDRLAIAKISANGVLDTTFGTSGKVIVSDVGRTSGAALAAGPGRRFTAGAGNNLHTARFLDAGANLTTVGTFNPYGTETGPGTISFIVGRTENLPTPLRVFLSVGGSARRPPFIPSSSWDYTGTNITFGNDLNTTTYVDIPGGQSFTTVTLNIRDDTVAEGDETILVSIRPHTSYDVGTPGSTTMVIRDNDITGGPTVSSSTHLRDETPSAVRVVFSQNVQATLSAADFQVTGPGGAGVPFTMTYDPLSNTALLRLTSPLSDGNHSVRVIASGISNGGITMPADHFLNFTFLAGDANGDGVVDAADHAVLRANYGLSGQTFSQGNFDYSSWGDVGLSDLVLLADNYTPGPMAFFEPTAVITPRTTPVNAVRLALPNTPTGLGLDDFTLTRNTGSPQPLTGATLTTLQARTRELAGLSALTSLPGQYRLRLNTAGVTFGGVPAVAPADLDFLVVKIGDLNCDGVVSNQDIGPFVAALTDPVLFQQTNGFDPRLFGDVNGDGSFNNQDISPFVALLTGSKPAPAPAPSPQKVAASRFASTLIGERMLTSLVSPADDTPGSGSEPASASRVVGQVVKR
jgi:uncharacterized delta-60 repeat protein